MAGAPQHSIRKRRHQASHVTPAAWTGAGEDRARATARFRLEARIAAHLARKTRHIVQVTDHGEAGGCAYLVMEFLEGRTLENRLSRGDPPSIFEVQEVVRQVAKALDCAHGEGVLHRDLKPSISSLPAAKTAKLS